MRFFLSGFLLLIALLPAAVAQNKVSTSPGNELPALNHFDPSIVDRDLDPCTDFYKFVCSKWQAANQIPADQSNWGTASNLQLWNESVLRNTMIQAANPVAERSAGEQKVGDYWYSCMDEATIDKKGIAPLKPELDRRPERCNPGGCGCRPGRLRDGWSRLLSVR